MVKIYHERTDSVGKPLMSSKTFTKKDMDAHLEDKRAKEKEPAYLTNNFNDIMQQIMSIKDENAELKAMMQYSGPNAINLYNLSKNDLDRIQTHLSMQSMNTVNPLTKTTTADVSLKSCSS